MALNRRKIIFGALFGAFSFSFARAQVAAPGTRGFDLKKPPISTVVQKGESLFDVAERTRSPLHGLIHINNLSPPYDLKEGQVLKLPPLKVHVVKKDETFEKIAARYSVQVHSLAVFNGLKKPYKLVVGQKIILPALVQDSYTGLEPQDLVALLALEVAKGNKITGNANVSNPIVLNRSNEIPKLPETIVKNNEAPPKPVETKPSTPKNIPNVKVVLTNSQPNFSWPIKGKILSKFGVKPGFETSDGIEIEGDHGEPFVAAEDGIVAYVGNRLKGYGWLILVKHNKGYLSAYAYGDSAIVSEGQNVKKGQILGYVGVTGRAQSPRLMFQIRDGTKPIDPLILLPKV